jgi:iron complex outermembrane receptor protein
MPTARDFRTKTDFDWRKSNNQSSFPLTLENGVAAEGEAGPFRYVLVAFLCIALCAPPMTFGAAVDGEKVARFQIPRQRADQALIAFAEQADVTFIFPVDKAREVMANEVIGEFTPKEAMHKLLEGTGLHSRFQPDGALSVTANNREQEKNVNNGRWLAGLFSAILGSAASDGWADQEVASAPTTKLNEVIVTAQKRAERLIDAPQSVSVISASDLAKLGATQFRDFANTVPGRAFSTAGVGFTQVS